MINKHFFFDENNKKTPKSTSKHKVEFRTRFTDP